MENDYGCDDIDWLENNSSEIPGTIAIQAHDRKFYIPSARFDNRVDITTFLRDDPKTWDLEKTRIVYKRLKEAFQTLGPRAFFRTNLIKP